MQEGLIFYLPRRQSDAHLNADLSL